MDFITLSGVSRVAVNTLENLNTTASSSTYDNKSVWGAVTGVGLKGLHSSGIFMKLEYVETDYQDITLTSDTGNRNTIDADIDQEAIRLAVGWAF